MNTFKLHQGLGWPDVRKLLDDNKIVEAVKLSDQLMRDNVLGPALMDCYDRLADLEERGVIGGTFDNREFHLEKLKD